MSRMFYVLSLAVLAVLFLGCQPTRRVPPPNLSAAERDVLGHRVSIGMDWGQVRRSWGDPCDKKTVTNAQGEAAYWIYCAVCPATKGIISQMSGGRRSSDADCGAQKTVTFTNGKVTEVQQ